MCLVIFFLHNFRLYAQMVNPIGPAPVEGNEDEELRATYAGARRRIAALEQQLQAFSEIGNKRKSYVLTCFLSSLMFIGLQ